MTPILTALIGAHPPHGALSGLARLAGTTQATLSRYATGKREPSPAIVARLRAIPPGDLAAILAACPRPLTPELRPAVEVALRLPGANVRAVARYFGLHPSIVRRVAVEIGVRVKGKLPPATVARIYALAAESRSAEAIAREVGVSPSAVKRWICKQQPKQLEKASGVVFGPFPAFQIDAKPSPGRGNANPSDSIRR